jgi:hypothetical protein
MTKGQIAVAVERAAWKKGAWCASAGISVSTFDELAVELRPNTLKIGRRVFILEKPADWLLRVAKAAPASLTGTRPRIKSRPVGALLQPNKAAA